jgi:hypothetical protein
MTEACDARSEAFDAGIFVRPSSSDDASFDEPVVSLSSPDASDEAPWSAVFAPVAS